MLNKDNVLSSEKFDQAATSIAKVGRFLAERGWSPATSSNYSIKLDSQFIAITRSGINKYEIEPRDIIVMDLAGQLVAPPDQKSSAETLIHTSIYKMRPQAEAVLHTHSPANTRLSIKFSSDQALRLSGYEMQKGLSQIQTHDCEVKIPILKNTQDMVQFSADVESLLKKQPDIHGFLIAGHGLYTWGSSLAETQRHIETYEFLFQCKTLELAGV